MNKNSIIKFIFLVLIGGFAFYSGYIRFSNPELTETQIFLKSLHLDTFSLKEINE